MTITNVTALRNRIEMLLDEASRNQAEKLSLVSMLYRRYDFCRRKDIILPESIGWNWIGTKREVLTELSREEILYRISEIDKVLFG